LLAEKDDCQESERSFKVKGVSGPETGKINRKREIAKPRKANFRITATTGLLEVKFDRKKEWNNQAMNGNSKEELFHCMAGRSQPRKGVSDQMKSWFDRKKEKAGQEKVPIWNER
jgi:hypothetical protein